MRWPWDRDMREARDAADRAEADRDEATQQRVEAEQIYAHAEKVRESVRNQLVRNGFADALRVAFGGVR